jgi:hypothetical protein
MGSWGCKALRERNWENSQEQTNPAESSKKGHCSERAILRMKMMEKHRMERK